MARYVSWGTVLDAVNMLGFFKTQPRESEEIGVCCCLRAGVPGTGKEACGLRRLAARGPRRESGPGFGASQPASQPSRSLSVRPAPVQAAGVPGAGGARSKGRWVAGCSAVDRARGREDARWEGAWAASRADGKAALYPPGTAPALRWCRRPLLRWHSI